MQRNIDLLNGTQPAMCCLITWLIGLWLPCHWVAAFDDQLAYEASPLSWQSDAELTDIFFINADVGWAVGAQGVILRTINGGRQWQELGQVNSEQVVQDLSLQQKIRALQQGTRTHVTGIADGREDRAQKARCRFESVFFIDEQNGWVAGGYHVPYLNHSRSIIMRTTDGGVTWRQVKGGLMPRLKRIHFTDRATGWAAGDRGHLLPGSLFSTTDGGETWSNQSLLHPRSGSPEGLNILDADPTARGFVVIDGRGELGVVRDGREEAAAIEARSGPPPLNRIRMSDANQGWAVGAAGAVWRTVNGGVSWSPLSEDPASEINRQFGQFDFQALAISPTKIWFAGNPGTQLFSIDRTTGAIMSYSTGVAAPIRGVHFVDDQNGWLVGSLGTIMATTDGGQSWQRQRGRHRSVAILGVAFNEAELPLEALTQFGCEEDYLFAAATCQPRITDAATQSLERLGGCGLSSVAALESLAGVDQASTDAQQAHLARLVRLIRTLRPNVIVCDSEYRKQSSDSYGDSKSQANAAFDPHLILTTAVAAAANPESFRQQIEIAGLEPWTVDRIAYRVPAGSLTIDSQKMLLRIGSLLEDQAALSRGLLNLPLSASEKKSYRIEGISSIRHVSPSDLFQGLSQSGRTVAQRSSDTRLRTNRTAIELANRKQHKIYEFAQFVATSEQDYIVWNQRMQEWLAPMDETLAGLWLAQLAQKYLDQGKIELASRSLEYLVNRYDGHGLQTPSLTWLSHYYTSDEFARIELANLRKSRDPNGSLHETTHSLARVGRPTTQVHSSHQDGQTIMAWAPVADKIELPRKESTFDSLLGGGIRDGTETDDAVIDSRAGDEAESPIQPASFSEMLTGFNESEVASYREFRWRRASQYLTQISQLDPDLINRPQFRLLEAHLKGKLGGNAMAEGGLKRLVLANEHSQGISQAAQQELKLAAGNGAAVGLAEAMRSTYAHERPRLDGQLQDSVWQTVRQRQLEIKLNRSRAGESARGSSTASTSVPTSAPMSAPTSAPPEPDQLMFAHDEEFLYVAIRCVKLPGQFYQETKDARSRDPDLSGRDRVELCIDLDRDYRTGFQFTVDHRGWGAEELNGARGWNPQWYIAQAEDREAWIIEMAIPLEGLILAPLDGTQVWAVRVARRVSEGGNLWATTENGLPETGVMKGLYQQILAHPLEFRPFMFH